MLPQIKQCEKKCFPSNEALNCELELKKRNVRVVVILHDGFSSSRQQLVAYLVFSHPKAGRTILLHKVCVVKDYRRQGVAKLALQYEIERLRRQPSSEIQLWVHKNNTAATELYRSVGFEIVKEIGDYYGPGRAGAQMSLILSQS